MKLVSATFLAFGLAIAVASCRAAGIDERCAGEADADCLACCEEATPSAYAALVDKLECTCVADMFCRDECAGQPFCSPQSVLDDVCEQCLGSNVFSNCGSSAAFPCRDEEGCRDAFTCLQSCSDG